MICKNCGKEILDNSKFCKYCGEKVEKEVIKDTSGMCQYCGNKVNDDWRVCPNCGNILHQINGVKEAMPGAESDIAANYMEEIAEEFPENKPLFTLGSIAVSGKLILKLLTLITLVCFFLPLCSVSCGGEKLISVSGTQMTFGFKYMGEDIEGNLGYGMLVVLSVIGVLAIFLNGNLKKRIIQLYMTAISMGAFFLSVCVIEIIMEMEVENINEVLEIKPCIALYVMQISSALATTIAWIFGQLMELQLAKNKKEELMKVVFTILTLIALMIFCTFLSIEAMGLGDMVNDMINDIVNDLTSNMFW